MLTVSLPYLLQRPLLRRVCCCGARGRLPPTGTSMCRTSTSGGCTTPNCGINRELQPIIFLFYHVFPPSFSYLLVSLCSNLDKTTPFPATPSLFYHLLFLLFLSFIFFFYSLKLRPTPFFLCLLPFSSSFSSSSSSSSSRGSVGRTAWLCVPSSTDTDLTSLTTPN